jgi:hypothetical protein
VEKFTWALLVILGILILIAGDHVVECDKVMGKDGRKW